METPETPVEEPTTDDDLGGGDEGGDAGEDEAPAGA
jgi:hypothetical protein